MIREVGRQWVPPFSVLTILPNMPLLFTNVAFLLVDFATFGANVSLLFTEVTGGACSTSVGLFSDVLGGVFSNGVVTPSVL